MNIQINILLALVVVVLGVGCGTPSKGAPGWSNFNPFGTPWVHSRPVVVSDDYHSSFHHERQVVAPINLAPGADFYHGGQSYCPPSQLPPRPYGDSYTTRSGAWGSYQNSHTSRVDSYDRVNCNGQVIRETRVSEYGNTSSQSGTSYERQWSSGQSGPIHYAPGPAGGYIQGNPPGFRILQGITTPRH